MKSYYTILGVARNATDAEIKTAFRKKALAHHPDVGGDPEKFKEASEAQEHLLDSIKRQIHDADLEAKEMGHHRTPTFHTPQFNAAHFNIPRARYRAYRREADDFSCFSDKQIRYIKTGSFYFTALIISLAIFGPTFISYMRTAQNPILSKLIEEMIQKTFQSTTRYNIGRGYSFPSGFLPIDTLEQKTSTACYAMVTSRNQTERSRGL